VFVLDPSDAGTDDRRARRRERLAWTSMVVWACVVVWQIRVVLVIARFKDGSLAVGLIVQEVGVRLGLIQRL
jgi:hypothetical protein